jgi:cellulose synthase/poly-beta-1,6-N-acetylglucosamine synthase-like glycosyltransferase
MGAAPMTSETMSSPGGIMAILLWLSFGLTIWTYFGYLVYLKIIALVRTRPVMKGDDRPPVSVVITAYNEERRIKDKIENTLAATYPKDRLEVIVVSDGSTDRTEEIVGSFVGRGVKLLAIPDRHGKHYGQGRGIQAAANDIVILTDATTFIDSSGIETIVRNFADPSIGCVSSEDRPRADAAISSGESAYVRYEMILRSLESDVCSLVGVSGSFFATRKSLCRDWIDNMSADFYMPIISRLNGYRTVLEREAFGYYEVVANPKKEFERKIRTIVHGLEVLFRFKRVLNLFRYGCFSFAIINHKLSRWLVPFYMLAALFANAVLIGDGRPYLALGAAQGVFYLLAILAWRLPRLRNLVIFKIPFFFVMVNVSILMSWYYYLIGREFVLWEPTRR